MMTPDEVSSIHRYWTAPPKEREEEFGTWPIHRAQDDIAGLVGHIAELSRLATVFLRANTGECAPGVAGDDEWDRAFDELAMAVGFDGTCSECHTKETFS